MTEDVDDAGEAPLWPLVRIDVRGLVGRTDVSLPLDSTATLLTGENGSGKSTILQAVHALATGGWSVLAHLPLTAMTVAFADGTELHSELRDETLHLSNQNADTWEASAASMSGRAARFRQDLRIWRQRRDRAASREELVMLQQRIDM